jgi:hypothetical protein
MIAGFGCVEHPKLVLARTPAAPREPLLDNGREGSARRHWEKRSDATIQFIPLDCSAPLAMSGPDAAKPVAAAKAREVNPVGYEDEDD